MSRVITSKPRNPSRKAAPGRFSRAGLRLPEPQMSAQHAAPAGSAGKDLEQYQSAGLCKLCWHVLTEGNERAQKFPLA